MRLPSSLGILAIIGFCLGISIYVSIPDYPYDAHPWAIMLWGEKSQWWSEITWIALFGVFGILAILLLEWNCELRGDRSVSFVQSTSRFVLVLGFVTLTIHFTALHFEWHGWYATLVLDRGGYLHGLFYLWTFILGLFCFSELMFLVSGIVRALRQFTIVARPRTSPGITTSSCHRKGW